MTMFRPLSWLLLFACAAAGAQNFERPLPELTWRCIGPFRAGRTVAIAGIADKPNVFFMAPTDGGVWKTDDYGRTWFPIFDGQPTGSVGALALAPSNPDIIYVGSGEGLRRPDLSTGDGIYKSTDGGKTWQHLGLRDGQQIGAIAVDPRDPDRLYVAVLGHPYGPNAERGVYRSNDGGAHFERVLGSDENTGAVHVQIDPADPRVLYADMWASRRPPWSVGDSFNAPGSGLYKSTDAGDHWTQLTGGLPDWEHDKVGRIGIGMSPGNPKRLYAMVDSPAKGGVYRSDDAGASWTRVNSETRVWGRGSDFAWVRVAPNDENTIYVANTSTYKSTDGGASFTAWKGAPGGDDYHSIWISPRNPEVILLGVDQGATITVNGGRTWSSWYNQPTAQLYHVITDNQHPYWVFGGQQESGSAAVASRGNDGEITFREFHPVGADEYAYIAPDPLDPNIVYGGPRGKVSRYHRDTGQVEDVTPAVLGGHRFNRTAPLIFSAKDPNMLLLGSDVMFRTTNNGQSWDVVSPDLSRPDPGVPQSLGVFAALDPQKGKHRGVIYSIAPSPLDTNVIWAGTDDGVIQMTHDAGTDWQNVTPPEMTAWSKVAQLDAGHFDAQTAYAAVNRFRLDDLRPYIYRTHDGGRTWQKIVAGLPENAAVNVVREDPRQKGLLFAGTETTVWVSFDDGDHWQSLQRNLPATSMRDLVVHEDDLVVGTHGRSFWILDDIAPLRELAAGNVLNADAYLFKPEVAYRYRRNTNTDTPLPPEEPAGKNPPDGVPIDYFLKDRAGDLIGNSAALLHSHVENERRQFSISVVDGSGNVVRAFPEETRSLPAAKDLNVPTYWLRLPQQLAEDAGLHRFIWDLHYTAPDTIGRGYPISAVYHDTPLEPQGPLAPPGEYTVKLTVNGKTYTQPLTIKEDPRVKVSPEDLRKQFELQRKLVAALHDDFVAYEQLRSVTAQLGDKSEGSAGKFTSDAKSQLDGMAQLNGAFAHIYQVIGGADAAPTSQAQAAFVTERQALDKALAQWGESKKQIPSVNELLRKAGRQPVDLNKPAPQESALSEDEP